MTQQELAVVLVLLLATYYLIKRFRKPTDNCGDNNCDCS